MKSRKIRRQNNRSSLDSKEKAHLPETFLGFGRLEPLGMEMGWRLAWDEMAVWFIACFGYYLLAPRHMHCLRVLLNCFSYSQLQKGPVIIDFCYLVSFTCILFWFHLLLSVIIWAHVGTLVLFLYLIPQGNQPTDINNNNSSRNNTHRYSMYTKKLGSLVLLVWFIKKKVVANVSFMPSVN